MSSATLPATARYTPEAPRDCPLCPRLLAFRNEAKRAEPAWFNGAVPSFGSSDARLLNVGLAPGLRGANRTGRPFTGDYAGFLAKHEAKYGGSTLSTFHAHAYDAANILFAALEKVAVVEADGTVYVPRKALREAIYATKDFAGITGTLSCSPSGDCGAPVIAVYQIVNSDPASWNPADPTNPNPKKVYP